MPKGRVNSCPKVVKSRKNTAYATPRLRSIRGFRRANSGACEIGELAGRLTKKPSYTPYPPPGARGY